MANALAWITKEAKRIRKKSPNMKYTTAIKKAGVEYRKKKPRTVSGTKKKRVGSVRKKAVGRKAAPRKKAAARKRVGATRRVSVESKVGTVRSLASQKRKDLEASLGRQLVSQYKATTKTAKRKIGKKVAELKKKIAIVGKLI